MNIFQGKRKDKACCLTEYRRRTNKEEMEQQQTAEVSYRFDLDDPTWVSYLSDNGYVVIKAVANEEQVQTAIDLFWEHFEQVQNVKRDDLESWRQWRTDKRGIVVDAEVIQCAGAWYVRGLPKIKQAFQKIWNEDDLIVSMDSLLLWKPWWLDPEGRWLPLTEGFHVDQNPFQKPDKICVQGMVPLYDVTDATGGLEVVPQSNLPKSQAALKSACPRFDGMGDFCRIMKNNPVIVSNGRKLLLAQAGDLILWDSRTIHSGFVGTGKGVEAQNPPRLARLTQTVCMVPRSRATPRILKQRRVGFEKGHGFTHWPNEAVITGAAGSDYKPVELTAEQLALL